MKSGVIVTAFITLLYSSVFAQELVYQTYEWDAKPKIHGVPESMKEYPAVYVLHNRFLELRVDVKAESFFTEHKIVHLSTPAGIERFNKVYIPLRADQSLVSLNVRSIDPSGKITVLKKENLKELKNVEGYGNFKIFAVEGLTVGGEMEYVYTTKSNPQTYGRYKIQNEIPVMASSVIILYPVRFVFIAKSYNGLTQPTSDFFNGSRRMIEATSVNVPALVEEQYSAFNANQMHLDFKLESGTPTGPMEWKTISENLLKSSFDPSAGSKVNRMLKDLKLNDLSDEQKIIALERHIKSNFTLKDDNQDDYENIKSIIENRVGNERGMLKLYLTCWEVLKLSPQVVVGANRFRGKLDPDFALPSDITDVLFYFPNQDKYISPAVPYLRFGAAPDHLAGSKGLFIEYGLGNNMNIAYRKHSFRTIQAMSYKENDLGINSTVKFNGKLDLPEIQHETRWQGYRGALYRGIYSLTPEVRRDEFLKEVALLGIENVTITKRDLEGADVNLSIDPTSYFRVKTSFTSPSLVEQAGGDYLLSVGKLIGRQSELYQESERQWDIEFPSIANYNHEITIEIPDGYTISGLEAIRINNTLNDGKEDVLKFYSDYELTQNTLKIKINEVYKVLSLPKEKYEAFRKVVNSAADFNKVVLVLQPK